MPKRPPTALDTGRPKGGAHKIGGYPKTAVRIDPDSGKPYYLKSRKIVTSDFARDRRIRSQHKRTKGQPEFKGDLPGSNV